ncbi:MAG: VTT domain-containing protein [Kiritimatiellae bacterium]|jgi:membrane protein DedA with SNARE-associated domain|nr:VTT domain-containing protein [Kiritimatiellia bacterium]
MPTPTQRSFVRRFRLRLLVGYALLLMASWIFTILNPPDASHLTYQADDSTPVDFLFLLDPLHESSTLLNALAEDLDAGGYRIEIPPLPGLNQAIPKPGGFAGIADQLEIQNPSPILIANGQAGGVGLHVSAQAGERIQALILVDASGVQEFNLLGEYHLNYALYALSDLALTFVDRLIPHFGQISDLQLARSQLNVLRASDRRTMRPLIDTISQPVLILQHPTREVEQHQAREHARILPRSRFVPLVDSAPLAPSVLEFVQALHAGQAPNRPDALQERVENSQATFNAADRPRTQGTYLLLLVTAIAFATLITEDVTGAITGLMIANGTLTWIQGVGACLAGILIGDYLLFLAGRHWGRPALARIPLRWMIDPMALRETEEWFSRHAEKAILISRFVPGTRLPAYVAAGILGIPIKRFTAWFVLAGLIWTPLFVSLAMLLSEQALEWIDRYHHTAPALLIGGVLLYLLLTHILLPSFNWRGRRKLLGKWGRLIHPEYWPAVLFYTPIYTYLFGRSFRKGNHFLDFTACNPSIPGSGIVEESKTAILDQIQEREAVASYIPLTPDHSLEDRIATVDRFVHEHGGTFPLVLKPDTGQRGSQVLISHSREDVVSTLRAKPEETWIVQRYIPGKEFGVFYIRDPKEAAGFIFGLTRKAFPEVVGDGVRSIEDLVLANDRTVCQYRMFMQSLGERIYEIPEKGTRIPLTQVGNHAKGTQFFEGRDLVTPELEAAIDRIAKSLPGFYFGRFDLRVPSNEDLKAGTNLKLIELNGLTSEATNLYDTRYHFREMVWILLKQWQWACHIGRHNRIHGHSLYPPSRILRDYDHFRKKRISNCGR